MYTIILLLLLLLNSVYGVIAEEQDFETRLLLSQGLRFKAQNVCHRHIHALSFKTAQKQKSTLFI